MAKLTRIHTAETSGLLSDTMNARRVVSITMLSSPPVSLSALFSGGVWDADVPALIVCLGTG